MKKFLVIFIAANVALGLLVAGILGGTLFLAETRPLDYSSPFYGVQVQAETWRLHLSRDEIRRAEFALKLVDRRLADLSRSPDEATISEAATTVQLSIDEAIRDIHAVPTENQEALFARLDQLLIQADVIVNGLVSTYDSEPVLALSDRLAQLQEVETREELVELAPPAPSIAAEIIPFLSRQVDHSDYPLEGAHADLECESCHTDGKYKGTSRECDDCHEPTNISVYADHFAGECVDCHTSESWMPDQFDHIGIVECESCHTKDQPVAHYDPPDPSIKYLAAVNVQSLKEMPTPTTQSGNDAQTDTCMRCHTDTTDWNVVNFDHFGFTDCASCHLEDEDTPTDHYTGQCSNCHTTATWEDAVFDHTGFTNCATCHTEEAPTAHFPGYACATCHTSTQWKPSTFSHDSVENCVDCHAQEAPAEHYTGQCSTCHNTDDWADAVFNHANVGDCLQCHQTPSIHWLAGCTDCHNTDNWQDTHFSHDGKTDCLSCHSKSNHYGGQCSKCHNTDTWGDASFDHGGLTTCAACHADEAQATHYPGGCENCHNTGSWSDATFNHSGATNCLDCHSDVLPPAHYSGDCTLCHATDSWTNVNFNHVNAINCTSCHEEDAPAEDHEYDDQCSECHTTVSWAFVHQGLDSTCSSCHTNDGHWPGECSLCHLSVEDWGDYKFDHTSDNYNDCKSCHARPTGHPRGQCSKCHTTDNWEPIEGSSVPDEAAVPNVEAPDRPAQEAPAVPSNPTTPVATTAPSR